MKKANQWQKQKALKKEEIPTQAQIFNTALNITNKQHRALYIIAYLTAGRISEILPTKHLRKTIYLKEVVEDEAGNKLMRVVRNKTGSPIAKSTTKEIINYTGIRRDNIEYSFQGGRRIMIFSMPNRKNRKHKRKRIPIPLDKEGHFVALLEEYLETLPENNSPLFKLSVSKAERLLHQYAGMNPHYLRDIRLTHMVTIYNYNAFQLAKFAGWKNVMPAERYIRLAVSDLLGGAF